MKKIIFRADGNSQSGLGHLYRLFALVEIYKPHFEFVFLTRENTLISIIPSDYHCKGVPNKITIIEEPDWINTNYPSSDYMIIADGYQFSSLYQKQIKHLGYTLFYIDDFANDHQYADVVINHSLYIKSSDYKKETYTQLALGTHYAVLRPGFLEAAKCKRFIKKISTLFICFGGTDPHNLTIKAIQAALNISEIKQIHAVIGAAYLHKEIFELEKKYSQLQLHQNITEQELIKVMEACDLAIAPASNILYELCAVKMPILSGYYVENQKNIYKGCLEYNIIIDGGNFEKYAIQNFEDKLQTILKSGNYQIWIDAQTTLFDSKISQRFLNLIPNITYRKATIEDMMLLYNWANDPVSRANSYFTEPISLETHKAWFEKKLIDKNCIIYIALLENEPLGTVRYEIKEDHAIVGILVDEKQRGKGMAKCFLQGSAKLYFEKSDLTIYAYIKNENLASMKSFEKAGYKKVKKEIVNGTESSIYTLNKNYL